MMSGIRKEMLGMCSCNFLWCLFWILDVGCVIT